MMPRARTLFTALGLKDTAASPTKSFIREAYAVKTTALTQQTPIRAVLKHLNPLKHDCPTHAALLLFGKTPQRFLLSSVVKCAHFHGTEVQKPIPSYQVYKGTAFDLVDQAVDFVLSKIDLAVGTRALSTQAPVAYEIPPEVVREAIVNAVAHRDYTSNGSVQVMLLADRLEVWNPGTLPPSLNLEKLRQPHGSVPGNPLLAEPLYLAKYIERMGTGTGDMIRRCRAAGLPGVKFTLTDGFVTTIRRKPASAFKAVGGQTTGQVTPEVTGEVAGQVLSKKGPQNPRKQAPEPLSAAPTPSVIPPVTGEVTGEVGKLLWVCRRAMTRTELQDILRLKGEENFRRLYLVPALNAGLVTMTIPEKPNSRFQKYRLTAKGRAWLDAQNS